MASQTENPQEVQEAVDTILASDSGTATEGVIPSNSGAPSNESATAQPMPDIVEGQPETDSTAGPELPGPFAEGSAADAIDAAVSPLQHQTDDSGPSPTFAEAPPLTEKAPTPPSTEQLPNTAEATPTPQ